MNYSPELKDAILRRILPPNSESITKVAREEGISEQTIRNWRDNARKNGLPAPGKDFTTDEWSTQDKFLTVVETAGFNETELDLNYCRYLHGICKSPGNDFPGK